MGDQDGEVAGPIDEWHKEGTLLKLGLLEGDGEAWAKTMGDPDGKVDETETERSTARSMPETIVLVKAHCSD